MGQIFISKIYKTIHRVIMNAELIFYNMIYIFSPKFIEVIMYKTINFYYNKNTTNEKNRKIILSNISTKGAIMNNMFLKPLNL